MRKRITIIVIALSLAVTSSGWAMTNRNNNLLIETIKEQKVDFDKQSTKIANLENVIVKKDDDLNAKNMVIEKQKLQINEQKKQLEKLKKQNEKLKQSRKNDSMANGRNIGSFEMTSYIAMCSEGCTGTTTTGINVKNRTMYQGHRIIATDPSVIPLWSIVKITTDNDSFTAISLDTGGGINGKEIDFLVSSEREAINIGRKIVSVELVRKGK
jgi:3D (Asp-Asp-Asp) domain-containing protein